MTITQILTFTGLHFLHKELFSLTRQKGKGIKAKLFNKKLIWFTQTIL